VLPVAPLLGLIEQSLPTHVGDVTPAAPESGSAAVPPTTPGQPATMPSKAGGKITRRSGRVPFDRWAGFPFALLMYFPLLGLDPVDCQVLIVALHYIALSHDGTLTLSQERWAREAGIPERTLRRSIQRMTGTLVERVVRGGRNRGISRYSLQPLYDLVDIIEGRGEPSFQAAIRSLAETSQPAAGGRLRNRSRPRKGTDEAAVNRPPVTGCEPGEQPQPATHGPLKDVSTGHGWPTIKKGREEGEEEEEIRGSFAPATPSQTSRRTVDELPSSVSRKPPRRASASSQPQPDVHEVSDLAPRTMHPAPRAGQESTPPFPEKTTKEVNTMDEHDPSPKALDHVPAGPEARSPPTSAIGTKPAAAPAAGERRDDARTVIGPSESLATGTGAVVDPDPFQGDSRGAPRHGSPLGRFIGQMIGAYLAALKNYHGLELRPEEITKGDRGALAKWAGKNSRLTPEEGAKLVEKWVEGLDKWALDHTQYRLRHFESNVPRIRQQLTRSGSPRSSRSVGCRDGDHAAARAMLTPEGRLV
jgi:hypothetical protein